MTDGVPVWQLQCPTCGDEFQHEIHYELPEPVFTDSLKPAAFVQANPVYVVCKQRHQWTLKTVTRVGDRDYVLLGDFIGVEP